MSLEKGAYPENVYVVVCHIKLAFISAFYVLESCFKTLFFFFFSFSLKQWKQEQQTKQTKMNAFITGHISECMLSPSTLVKALVKFRTFRLLNYHPRVGRLLTGGAWRRSGSHVVEAQRGTFIQNVSNDHFASSVTYELVWSHILWICYWC